MNDTRKQNVGKLLSLIAENKYLYFGLTKISPIVPSITACVCLVHNWFWRFNNRQSPTGESQKQDRQTDNTSTMLPFPAIDLFHFLFPNGSDQIYHASRCRAPTPAVEGQKMKTAVLYWYISIKNVKIIHDWWNNNNMGVFLPQQKYISCWQLSRANKKFSKRKLWTSHFNFLRAAMNKSGHLILITSMGKQQSKALETKISYFSVT